jgi:hypothetical protein
VRAVGTVVYAIPPSSPDKPPPAVTDVLGSPLGGPYPGVRAAANVPMVVLRDGEGRLLHFTLPPRAAGGGGETPPASPWPSGRGTASTSGATWS